MGGGLRIKLRPPIWGADSSLMSYATTMVYSRALTYPEAQMKYRSWKAKMAARGVTVQ